MDARVVSALKPRTDISPVSAVQKDDENGAETIGNRFRPRMRADLVEVYKNGPWDKAPNN